MREAGFDSYIRKDEKTQEHKRYRTHSPTEPDMGKKLINHDSKFSISLVSQYVERTHGIITPPRDDPLAAIPVARARRLKNHVMTAFIPP